MGAAGVCHRRVLLADCSQLAASSHRACAGKLRDEGD